MFGVVFVFVLVWWFDCIVCGLWLCFKCLWLVMLVFGLEICVYGGWWLECLRWGFVWLIVYLYYVFDMICCYSCCLWFDGLCCLAALVWLVLGCFCDCGFCIFNFGFCWCWFVWRVCDMLAIFWYCWFE